MANVKYSMQRENYFKIDSENAESETVKRMNKSTN